MSRLYTCIQYIILCTMLFKKNTLHYTEAQKAEISEHGFKSLDQMLCQHRDVVQIRPDRLPSAGVIPLSICLKPNAVLAHAKPRRYPPQRREFIQRDTAELQKIGFIRPAVRTDWVAVPLVVPKKLPPLLRPTMDYHRNNSATQETVWPMPRLNAVLSDTQGAKVSPVLISVLNTANSPWQRTARACTPS